MNARVRNADRGKNPQKKNGGKKIKGVNKESFKKKPLVNSGLKILSSQSFSNNSQSRKGDVEDSNILYKQAALQCQKDDSMVACSSWN